MSVKINLLRKSKAFFIRLKLHKIFGPLNGFFLNLTYLSKVSKWIDQHKKDITFNDFYSGKWDYNKRFQLYEHIFSDKHLEGTITYLEFGVSGGFSFDWWLKRNIDPSSRFVGFDTFEGLPEDWGGFAKGAMSTQSMIPQTDDKRATFIKGLFQDTLPGYLKTFDKNRRKVIMMDADLYTSTLYVLTSLAPFLQKGDIVFFDQFNVPTHEFLAFTNFVDSYYIKMKWLGAANNYYFCAFEVE
jgi:O-methyltransferase